MSVFAPILSIGKSRRRAISQHRTRAASAPARKRRRSEVLSKSYAWRPWTSVSLRKNDRVPQSDAMRWSVRSKVLFIGFFSGGGGSAVQTAAQFPWQNAVRQSPGDLLL